MQKRKKSKDERRLEELEEMVETVRIKLGKPCGKHYFQIQIWQTASSGLNFAAIEENIHNAPQTWYMSCKIMLILTVRPLAFQGYTILHITYLKKFQKLEFFEKNRKKSRNSRFLLRTIFSMLSAKSFTSQGHLIAKKKICGRGNIITSAAFFSFLEKMIPSTQTCCG